MTVRLLLPIDGSAVSEQVLPAAERLARSLGLASVEVLHVVDTQELLSTPSEITGDAPRIDLAVERARQYVTEQAARLDKLRVPASGTVGVGPPAEVILDRIAKGDIDYVYMATHGRSGLARRAVGSVTEQVLRQSAVPVVVMHPSMREGSTSREALEGRSTSDLVHLFSPPDAVARLCLTIVISRGVNALPALLDGLASSDSHVRQYAVRALGAIGAESCVPQLVDCLRDEILEVRWEAAEALARFGAHGIAATLSMLTEDPLDSRVALAARHVLEGASVEVASALYPVIQALGDFHEPGPVRLVARAALAAQPTGNPGAEH